MSRSRRFALLANLWLLLSGLLLVAGAGAAGDGQIAKPGLVGGPCDYARYPGTARILEVVPARPGEFSQTSYQGFRVTFTFTPEKPLAPVGIYEAGKAQTLTLVNGAAPGPKFLKKYSLAPGRTLPCELLVIRQGTCTPVLFRFPGIDLADYFETGQ